MSCVFVSRVCSLCVSRVFQTPLTLSSDSKSGWHTVRRAAPAHVPGRRPREPARLSREEAARLATECVSWKGADALEIDLSGRGIGDGDVVLLAEVLQDLLIHRLLDGGEGASGRLAIDVKLERNRLRADGVRAVCGLIGNLSEVLADSAPYLRALYLFQNQLDDEAMRLLGDMIRRQRGGCKV